MKVELPKDFFSSYNNAFLQDLNGILALGLYRLTPEQLSKIKIESTDAANDYLVGHLKNEFMILDQKTIDYVISLLEPFVYEYDRAGLKSIKEGSKIEMQTLWVNKQKKNEFNPAHSHTGLYSFVIWVDIPYTRDEENQCSPYKGENKTNNRSGSFTYFSVNRNGHVDENTIDCSKEMNGTVLLFPSETLHIVYPFYSSDEERITIAGNLKLAME